ncbi:MAG TPA: VWA domain-containing protein [Thermoanaerobaculia bacterium]|nr:VWA domain-containing protein [Thermoanaerobaculia bacterium]
MRRAILVLSLVAALDARPQTFFSETLEIRVTNVDVIVTTKDGQPVPGLTRADFEIYEDGVRKEISNFLEIRGDVSTQIRGEASIPEAAAVAEAQTDVRRRHILVFIDNSGLHPLARNAVLPHLQSFIEKNVRAGDSVTIATWALSLKAETLARVDRLSLEDALKRLSLQTSTSDRFSMRQRYEQDLEDLIVSYQVLDQKPPFTAGMNITRNYGMQLVHHMRAKTEALKSLMAAFRGADGRKVLVLLTQAFSTNPAEELFLHLDSVRERFADGETANVYGDMRELEIASVVPEIAEIANSSGISLYPIDVGGKLSDLELPDASVERRIGRERGTLVANTMGPLLSGIADATGGKALTGSSNWQLAFDTIANDLTSYYSLGYRSEGEREDRLKKIEVRPKNRKYVVRARSAVVERTLASEMSDAVAANLFREASNNDLKIRVTAGDPSTSGDGMLVPITITIPTNALTLLPDGSDLTGRFSIFAAFMRNDGAVSKTAREEQQFRFPAASLERRKEITVKLDVNADARTDGISVGVMDDVSHATGFASVKLTR